ncbi:SPla/RYanodine receptor SPRY [Penicillium chermesinum]|uniref:Protein FYV10 n=1 Tax=Penicillium chermesinum TaxID=63820 RepID=A0A9W9TL05_9EURO|nr:SPla/RYanodine receptor SPRY [Penicillium chermesinum]KAJ5225080.1 SPla/RYanodine receptor SPRY [Penicillium chermesinum]
MFLFPVEFELHTSRAHVAPPTPPSYLATPSPPISGSFSNILNPNTVSSYPPPLQPDGRLHRALSGLDAADMHHNSAWRSSSDSLPSHSLKYAGLMRSSDFSPSLSFPDSPSFFTPSYLRHSRYVSRLDAAHRARLAAQQRDASSSTSAPNTSLSTSSSNVHLPKMALSHRGMTYDLIEHPPATPDPLMPLPTQWSPNRQIRRAGFIGRWIEAKPKEGMIGIGFSSTKASVERLPGWEQESWAYHGDDGKSFFGESQGQGRAYGPTFGVGDTVGCGVNFSTGCAFFTKNGIFLGDAFHDVHNVKLYPSVGMKKQPKVHLKANFGQYPFVFDIDGMVKFERSKIQAQIKNTSVDSLQPPLGESALLQELVAQFLAHDGYVETARAFAEEVATETAALQNGHEEPLKKYEVEEDREAINRNRIRAAILDGDIDKALKHTKAYYAKVLESNPQIHFKLRCRKFLEMMRRASELSTESNFSQKRMRTDSPSPDEHAVFDQEMELDDGEEWNADGMDTESDIAEHNNLLTEAVQYCQQLSIDFPSDENGGDKKMLDDIFSLVAYPDPKRSVHGHYLDPAGRVAVAEELNSAILVSLGKSSSAALEWLYQQTEVLVNEISEDGGAGAFINVRDDILL